MNRRRAWFILSLAVSLTVIGGWQAFNLERDDDLLAFLPQSHPKIVEFREMASTFGNTQLVLIGLSHPEMVTEKNFRARLDSLSRNLKMLDGVHDVVGLTTITDFTVNEFTGALELRLLLDEQKFASDRTMLSDILSRDHLVGTVVSKDGRHTLLYAYVSPHADPISTVAQIETELNAQFSPHEYHLGGAPVISADIFNQTQKDLDSLTPWAVVVIIVLLMLAYRDVLGAGIALVVTGGAISIAIGGLVLMGEPLNVVVSAAPIVLFAVGTAFSQHLLSHYLEYRRVLEPGEALTAAVAKTRRPLAAAAFTSALGLASFSVMDLEPVRIFGLFTAAGILLSWLGARYVLPSFLILVPLKSPQSSTGGFLKLAEVILEARFGKLLWAVGGLCFILALIGLHRLDSRVDMDALLPAESRGTKAMAYMAEHFGGSEFVFIHLKGELKEPVVIHGLEALAAELAGIDGIQDVMHVGVLLSRTYEGMVGREGLPTTVAQASTLFGLLTGAPMISQLMSSDESQALIQVRLKPLGLDGVERALAEIRHKVSKYNDFGKLTLEDRRERWANALLGKASGQEMSRFQRFRDAKAGIAGPTSSELEAELSKRLDAGEWLIEEAALVELPAETVARSWSAGSAGPEIWVKWLKQNGTDIEPGPVSEDAWFALSDIAMAVEETIRREMVVEALTQIPDFKAPRSVLGRVWDVFESSETLSGELAMVWKVNGLPVMYEGLSESIEKNQMKSTGAAYGAVLLLLLLFLRRVSTVLWIALPITFTLVCIYGGMGLLGVRLDIGTSMLSSLALGVGVDYAVHAFMGDGRLSRGSAGAIVTNALVVAAGFSVLTLAASPPIQLMGALTALAMVLAAVTTLVVYTLSERASWLTEGKD